MLNDRKPTINSPGEDGPGEALDTDMPLERLEEQICELAAHLAAGTCRFLQLVASRSAPRKKPSTAPAASTSATPQPGSTRHPRRINGRDH